MSSSLERPLVHRSFEAWTDLEPTERRAIQVCHPDWRGVRTATYAFRTPVVESPDFSADAEDLAVEFKENGVETLVVQAWPQGSAALLEAASNHGIGTRVVFHSSMAQHGTDAGESEAVSEALRLANAGTVDRIGFVKEGLAEVFRSLGFDAAYVPNRVPDLPPIEPVALGSALNIGILLDPYWRKNVTTQLGAVAILEGRAHVVRQPDVGYLEDVDIVEHGNLDWETFISLQAGMTLNFNVTLSECHPMSPMESYLSGVPCLVSATSALFREDPDLYELTTVADADNPRAIADKATQLLDRRSEAVDRARAWLVEHDKWAAEQFHGFASIDPPEHT
jgi:hypothetical protein